MNELQRFFEVFRAGFEEYMKGDWREAKKIFDTVEDVKGFIDQPTRNLIQIMEDSQFKAPSNWTGYRELNEK